MKVGYPDTINSSAAAASPVKARYASSGEGEDLKAVEIKKGSLAKKEDPPTNYSDTPINMITPNKDRNITGREASLRARKTKVGDKAMNFPGEKQVSEKRSKRLLDREEKIGKKIRKIRDKKSPVKSVDIIGGFRADRKAAAEKAKKAEAAIRQSQSSSETTTEPTRKKNKIGRAIQARKERRAERNPKVAERQKGRAERKELNKDIKTEKARVTTARQERKTSKTTDRLDKVKKKVDGKVTKIKSPAKFASAAQRKAVWASKNEKKKK